MKISLYVQVHLKTIPWKFRILYPKNSRVIYPWKIGFFWKSRLLFNIFYCFCMFVNKYFIHLSGAHNSKSKWCYNAELSAYYFYVKTKISIDFQICISVPLIANLQNQKWRKIINSHFHLILISHVYISTFMSVWNGWKSQFG